MRSGEFTAKRTIRRRYAEDFAYSERLLVEAHRIHRVLCERDVPPGQNSAKTVAVGLWMKTCKQYRSVLVLGELGLVEDAEVIVRSLFETTIQTAFVLKRNIRLSRGWGTAPKAPHGGYSTEFRARLYLARQVVNEEKRTKAWHGRVGLKTSARRVSDAVAEKVRIVETWLGPAWVEWLRCRSMAAFKVETMAGNVGLARWYHAVYGPQSTIAHAGDALTHLRATDDATTIDAKLGADIDSVPGPLHLANAMCGLAARFVNSRFRLGLDRTLADLAAGAQALLDRM